MPLVIQGLIDVPLLWWGRRATWDYLTPIVLVSYVAITTFGFLMATVGYRRPLRIGIAVAYFPAILCLLFLEGLYLDARLYHNTF